MSPETAPAVRESETPDLQALPQWSRRPATKARGTRRVKVPEYRKGKRQGFVTSWGNLQAGTIIVTPRNRPDLQILRRKGGRCLVRYAAAPGTGVRWVNVSRLTGLPAIRL